MKRIQHEPAFILHHHDWSETSVIVEALSRAHGRVALVAKGAKRPSSNFRPVLLPLQPLRLSWTGEGEIRSLKAAEWAGGHVMPGGEALLSGYYVNELLLRLLARDDAHPALFDAYAALVQVLASGGAGDAAGADLRHAGLRAFELLLLRYTGHLPALNEQTLTLAPLRAGDRYTLVPEGGLRAATDAERATLSGAQWLALARALEDEAPFVATLRAVTLLDSGDATAASTTARAAARTQLRHQLRALLHYHCGVGTLRTRQLMNEMQTLLP